VVCGKPPEHDADHGEADERNNRRAAAVRLMADPEHRTISGIYVSGTGLSPPDFPCPCVDLSILAPRLLRGSFFWAALFGSRAAIKWKESLRAKRDLTQRPLGRTVPGPGARCVAYPPLRWGVSKLRSAEAMARQRGR
jgi:hypothetical protein